MSTCAWCGDPLAEDDCDELCKACDAEHVDCSVCAARVHLGACRHVYEDRDGEVRGCGAYSHDGHAEERTSLHRLLDALGLDDVLAIQRAIDRRRFNVCFYDGLIEGRLECDVGDFGSCLVWDRGRDIGDSIVEAVEDDKRLLLGAEWLRSLQATGKRTTEAACKLTIRWIREWPPLAQRIAAFRASSHATLRATC